MLKPIRLAVVAFTACFAMSAGAQSSVKVGKDGSVKVHSGGTKVDVGGGKVNVQTQGSDTQVDMAQQDDDGDEDTDKDEGKDSEIDFNGSGRKETLTCEGDTEVSINGSANELTLTGECKRVSVSGSTNKVTLDGVGRIDVSGSSNSVTWKRATGGAKKPKVSSSGVGNKVSKAK